METINLGRVAFVYKGDYSALTTYNKMDVVFDGESSFVSQIDNNVGNELVNGLNWKYLSRGNNLELQEAKQDIAALETDLNYAEIGIVSKLIEDLNDVRKKTTIKLFGDSITQGVGASGYSPTGDVIPTTNVKRDLFTSLSWANLLRNYLNNKFNRELSINPLYDKYTEAGTATGVYNEGLISITFAGDYLVYKTQFSGTNAKIGYYKRGNYGIFKIIIDGVFFKNVDCYSSTWDEYAFDEVIVPDGVHTLEIRSTASRNPLSTGNWLVFTYLKLQKNVELINNGISGHQSHAVSITIRNTVLNTDDYIFYMAGTNDRKFYDSAWRTYSVVKFIYRWLKANRPNVKMIVMSANPCGNPEYIDPLVKFTMEDVDNALRKACYEDGIPYISNYKLFAEWLINESHLIEEISADNLHPNDLGHKFIFENILYNIGLSPKTNF